MHCRRGEATEEYISDMQSPECNRYNQSAQSIVLQPMSNNTHIQKTKYYESEVCCPNLFADFTIFSQLHNM